MWNSFNNSDVYKLEAQVSVLHGIFENAQKNSACVACASLSDTAKYLLTSLDAVLGSWTMIVAGSGAHRSID